MLLIKNCVVHSSRVTSFENNITELTVDVKITHIISFHVTLIICP